MKSDTLTPDETSANTDDPESITSSRSSAPREAKTRTDTSCLVDRYLRCRRNTHQLTDGLTTEDMVVQSMPDASPTKWHLAHTTWFFEQFVLKAYDTSYREFDPHYNYLFNSYYNNVGQRHSRELRGLLTRPSFDQVIAYRDCVDEAISDLLHKTTAEARTERMTAIYNTIEVGLHHEMQHQELLLTDILHTLSLNSLYPAMRTQISNLNSTPIHPERTSSTAGYQHYDEGIFHIGAPHSEALNSEASRNDGAPKGNPANKIFSFDCEHPRHQVYLQGFALAQRTVSNREWLEFMRDGGYSTATLWLSDGWAQCQHHQWQAPLYWVQQDGVWQQFSHYGLQPIDLDAPVCHINYYEADAFACWANARLPTEQEWEIAAGQQPIQGNFQEDGIWLPKAAQAVGMQQLYGDVWEWTRSAYSPYPGYRAPAGAIGEYNGKFMSGQFVLRGGSCVTPIEQLRPSYRNFFYPHQRWQFSGLRLAKDL